MQASAVYFDGLRPVSRTVKLALTAQGLGLSVNDAAPFVWDYASIRLQEDGTNPLRFHREQSGSHTGEQIEIESGDFADALKLRCLTLGGTQIERSRMQLRIIGWSAAAIASILALVFYGVPALATKIAPLVPWRTEVALGNAVEREVMRALTGGKSKACTAEPTDSGHQALQKLVNRITSQAVLPGAVDVKVIDSTMENAFALPGGKIFLMRGLIEKAKSADEVAGVLAHEFGHMAHRDAMRGIIHAGGISFLVGTLLGDFSDAGALVITSKFLLGSRYSRENETQADAFAVEVMTKAGGDVKALGSFLRRVAKQPGERQLELLLSHPVTDDRIAEIERQAPLAPPVPLLSEQEWASLQRICKTTTETP